MIETVIRNYLTSKLNIPVLLERPKDVPASYVIIEKTGSSTFNLLETSTFAIQSYAPSLYAAADLNNTIKGFMRCAADECPEISSAQLNSDYNYTDEETKEYRYQAVFDITHYER